MLTSDKTFDKTLVEVDEEKVKRLIYKIIVAETKNIKSGEKNDQQMAQTIRKMIEEEVKCY